MSSIRHTALFNDLYSDILDWSLSKGGLGIEPDVLAMVVAGVPTELNGRLITVEELSVKEYAAGALMNAFLKKFQDGHLSAADAVAQDKFTASNVQCRDWKVRSDRSLEEDLLLGLFKQEVYRFFNRGPNGHILGSMTSILNHATTGPGASLGANGTDFYTKMFSSKLTGTSKALYAIYAQHITNIPFWSSAEIQRADQFGEFSVLRGNRLSFVPKNVDASRCICTEPLLNMFFQQGVKGILEKRLRQYFGIDLSNQQECNRDLARIGSMTERFVTIDLSNASDTVSLGMIRETFPADVVSWLELFRSPEVQLPNGKWMDLYMISSMGNAYTFPLETIIFSCIVSAAYQMKDKTLMKGYGFRSERDPKSGAYTQSKYLPNFGVFGDDIIVEEEHYRHTAMLLELLGFTLNAEKSFDKGPFRESCGGDFFRGYPVRGVYIKSLRTQASRYVAINRLNEWSALHGIPLCKTVQRLVKSVRYLPVPLYENDDAGIKVPFHMVEGLKRDADTQSILYRRWESKAQKIRIQDGALKLPKGAKHRIYNGEGLLIAGLRGDVRNETIGSRLGPCKYRSKEAISPNWDWLPPVATERSVVGPQRLAAAAWINLTS